MNNNKRDYFIFNSGCCISGALISSLNSGYQLLQHNLDQRELWLVKNLLYVYLYTLKKLPLVWRKRKGHFERQKK